MTFTMNIRVWYSDTNRCFIAHGDAMHFLSAHGDTANEALRKYAEALSGAIESEVDLPSLSRERCERCVEADAAESSHVDRFIDEQFGRDKYARFVLNYFRLPAALQADFAPFMNQFKLFCTYEGKRYRCTGASRLGDLWLASNFEREHGYDLRVDVEKCSDWGKEP
jgi:predicted RNase H-like HicB family nuclease